MNKNAFSFYTVEAFVQPGAVRESIVIVVNNLEDLKEALEVLVSYESAPHQEAGEQNFWLTICNRTIRIRTFQQGVCTQDIDVLPHLTYFVSGYDKVEKDTSGTDILWLNDSWGIIKNPVKMVYGKSYPESIIEIKYEINWGKVGVEPLQIPIMQKGDKQTIGLLYVGEKKKVGLLAYETEQGLYFKNWKKSLRG